MVPSGCVIMGRGAIRKGMAIIRNAGIILASGVRCAIILLKSELVMGDSNTGNDVFDSVGFCRSGLYSSDNLCPDSLHGYALTVRGSSWMAAKLMNKTGMLSTKAICRPARLRLPISILRLPAATLTLSDGR